MASGARRLRALGQLISVARTGRQGELAIGPLGQSARSLTDHGSRLAARQLAGIAESASAAAASRRGLLRDFSSADGVPLALSAAPLTHAQQPGQGSSGPGENGNRGQGPFNNKGWGARIFSAALSATAAAFLLGASSADAKEATKAANEFPPGGTSVPQSQVSEELQKEFPAKRKPRLVVLGTGWAAVSFLKSLDTKGYDVIVISPRNYFVFTPLLPSVTVGSVEARSVSEPIRRIVHGRGKNAQYLEAECIDIDPVAKSVRCKEVFPVQRIQGEEFDIAYDKLVIAVGARVNTFGVKGVMENCHFLKEVEDAERIHQHVVDCFEAASMPCRTDEQRKRLLTFVVVGGGPTGVEFAAELHDLIKEDLERLYPEVKGLASIKLVQAADHILNMFDKRLSEYATAKFSRDGISVLVNKQVTEVKPDSVVIKDFHTQEVTVMEHGGFVVWSTGIGTRPLMTKLMAKIGQTDRRVVATDEWLRVKGARDVWALGDCATIEQRRMRDDISQLFKMADVNQSGYLDEYEFKEVLKKVGDRYPQIVLYLRRKTFRDLLKDLHLEQHRNPKDPPEDDDDEFLRQKHKGHVLRIKDFEEALKLVDMQFKSLPATAQVAAQQGAYLAECFNKDLIADFEAEGPPRVRSQGRHKFHPFRYRHLGQFATFGTGQAGVELPGDWVNVGRSTQWLWYSVYASKQVSWRTRALVVFDWLKRAIFGRDSSRM